MADLTAGSAPAADPSRPTRWHLHPLADLHWRRWDDDWVVFDVGSCQTHRMESVAAVALLTLQDAPSLTRAEIAEQVAAEFGVDDAAALHASLDEVLERLRTAGLIEAAGPCASPA